MASDWPRTFFTARLFLFSIYIYRIVKYVRMYMKIHESFQFMGFSYIVELLVLFYKNMQLII